MARSGDREDNELIAKMAVLGGGRHSFRVLFLLINDDIYRYFRDSTKDVRDAEDLTADTSIALGRNIGRLKPHPMTGSYWDAICAWWRAAAKLVLLNFRKRSRRRHDFLERYLEHSQTLRGAPSPEDILIVDEERQNVLRITEDHIAALSPEKRAIFDDHRAGMSHADIAAKYGKNASAIRQTISREIRALRKKLTDHERAQERGDDSEY